MASFAGSRSLDERRRRRLAQESVDGGAPAGSVAVPQDAQVVSQQESDPTSPESLIVVESLIPKSPWLVAAIGIVGVACWAGLLRLGSESWNDPRFRKIFRLDSGRLAGFFSTICLILSAEISGLILWYRSRSRKDFGGRYRIWGWSALFWIIVALCAATDIHLPVADRLYQAFPLNVWRPMTLYWLGPCAVAVLALYRLLSIEMRQCRASLCFWNASVLCAATLGLLELGLNISITSGWRAPVATGVATLWHLLTAFTFLVHGRFVIHVTNEACPKMRTWTGRILRRVRSQFAMLRDYFRAEEADEGEQTAAKRRQSATAKPNPPQTLPADPPTKPKKPAKPTRAVPQEPKIQRTRVMGRSIRVDKPESPNASHLAPAELQSPTPAVQNDDRHAFDDATDHDADDGPKLSKRERRRLRKLQKQKNRN